MNKSKVYTPQEVIKRLKCQRNNVKLHYWNNIFAGNVCMFGRFARYITKNPKVWVNFGGDICDGTGAYFGQIPCHDSFWTKRFAINGSHDVSKHKALEILKTL